MGAKGTTIELGIVSLGTTTADGTKKAVKVSKARTYFTCYFEQSTCENDRMGLILPNKLKHCFFFLSKLSRRHTRIIYNRHPLIPSTASIFFLSLFFCLKYCNDNEKGSLQDIVCCFLRLRYWVCMIDLLKPIVCMPPLPKTM